MVSTYPGVVAGTAAVVPSGAGRALQRAHTLATSDKGNVHLMLPRN